MSMDHYCVTEDRGRNDELPIRALRHTQPARENPTTPSLMTIIGKFVLRFREILCITVNSDVPEWQKYLCPISFCVYVSKTRRTGLVKAPDWLTCSSSTTYPKWYRQWLLCSNVFPISGREPSGVQRRKISFHFSCSRGPPSDKWSFDSVVRRGGKIITVFRALALDIVLPIKLLKRQCLGRHVKPTRRYHWPLECTTSGLQHI